MQSTLTSKGQLTLPKSVRDALQLTAGMRLNVKLKGQSLELTPVRVDAMAVRGILKSPLSKPPTVAEMDAGIAQFLRRKHVRTPA